MSRDSPGATCFGGTFWRVQLTKFPSHYGCQNDFRRKSHFDWSYLLERVYRISVEDINAEVGPSVGLRIRECRYAPDAEGHFYVP